MADTLTVEARSRLMAKVKGRDTKPEKKVRRLLHAMGYRFRLYRKDLPGKPDIVLPRHRKVIFVHGCFWHGHPGCRRASRPTDNAEFWNAKLDANLKRDAVVLQDTRAGGWKPLIVWECETRDLGALEDRLNQFLNRTEEHETHGG